MEPLAFIGRNPTWEEIEKLRLLLSTFQDGTGQLTIQGNQTLPGWRDFERSFAAVFGGKTQENKAIFDVLLPDPIRQTAYYGVSCKMRGTLNEVTKTGRVTLELSNSSGKFWDELKARGLTQQNYRANPREVGSAIIDLINHWHAVMSIEHGGNIDLTKSFYLVLSWNRQGFYQLHQFPLTLPHPETLNWSFPTTKQGNQGRRLMGTNERGVLFEWYGESGGQLKYYPSMDTATWLSEKFQLEPLPNIEYGIQAKAKAYFPHQWSNATMETEEKR